MGRKEAEIRSQKQEARSCKKSCLFFLVFCLLLLVSSSFAQDGVKESLAELNRIPPAKKTVGMPWGRDPFLPLVGAGFTNAANLRLTAIIYNDKRPSAIINNKIVYIGDNVEGQKVIDITKRYVILHGSSGSYNLEMNNKGGGAYGIKKTP